MTWGDAPPPAPRIPGGNPAMRPDQAIQLPATRAGSGPAPQSAIVVARLVIIVGTTGALFVYSPTAGPGNLVASLAAAAGTDSFGNAYDAGLTAGSSGGAHIGLGLTGDLFVHNAATAIVDWIHAADGSIRIYNSGGAAAGNLIASIAPVAGSDPFGNAYLQGVSTYTPGSFTAELVNGQLLLSSVAAITKITVPGTLTLVDAGAGSATPELVLTSPATSAVNVAQLILGGESQDASKAAFWQLTPGGLIAADLLAGAVLTVSNAQSAPTAPSVQFLANAAGDRVLGIEVTGDANFRFRVDSNGVLGWTFGASGAAFTLGPVSNSQLSLTGADLDIASAGNGLRIKEGANARMGVSGAMVAGTITIANTSVTASTRVFLSHAVAGGALGALSRTINAGVSFTINSSSNTDTSTVNWLLIEPG
jgi:hypothetical protein